MGKESAEIKDLPKCDNAGLTVPNLKDVIPKRRRCHMARDVTMRQLRHSMDSSTLLSSWCQNDTRASPEEDTRSVHSVDYLWNKKNQKSRGTCHHYPRDTTFSKLRKYFKSIQDSLKKGHQKSTSDLSTDDEPCHAVTDMSADKLRHQVTDTLATKQLRQLTVSFDCPSVCSTDDELDYPGQNFGSSLTLGTISNGSCSMELSLTSMPRRHLCVNVCNNRLEIVVDKKPVHKSQRSHTVSIPYYLGYMDLPMYLDASKLSMNYDVERDVLVMQGPVKGTVIEHIQTSCVSKITFLQRSDGVQKKVFHDGKKTRTL